MNSCARLQARPPRDRRPALQRGPAPACSGWPSTLRNMGEDGHGGKRFGAGAQAAEWDARYSERAGAIWSGRPNGRLVAEVAGLAPGRALDVGCGEGADAVWLARSGWTVTAIDISDVAVSRAREAAELAGVAVEWVCGDALQISFPAGSFDLVSMQYPALPKAAGEAAVRALLDTVRPGGPAARCLPRPRRGTPRAHEVAGRRSRGLRRCGRARPASRPRLHGRSACGRAAHRPAARPLSHRRRRLARPASLTSPHGR